MILLSTVINNTTLWRMIEVKGGWPYQEAGTSTTRQRHK